MIGHPTTNRTMKHLVPLFCLLLFFLCTSCDEPTTTNDLVPFNDETFKAGQIWEYKTRAGEEASRMIILKTEKTDRDTIIHISVFNAQIKNPHIEGGIAREIGHLPFARAAIEKSVTKLNSSNNPLPKFLDGYLEWKASFNAGEGGIFTISVKEAVAYVEEAMNQ